MPRRIVRTGSSLAVTRPRDIVEQLDLKQGDPVEVALHPRNGTILIRTAVREFEDGKVTKRFRKLTGELLTRRARLYRELAK